MNLARFDVQNYRGRNVPQILGIAIAVSVVILLVGLWGHMDAARWGLVAGAGLVFAAGLIDDLAPVGPRGLRNHVRELASGHMTTGILKLIVTLGASVLAVALIDRGDGPTRLASVLLVAGTTNVWNGLDVRPGRALKAFIVGTVVLALTGARGAALIVVLLAPIALVALWFDLRERAMLGDAGANLLGFSVGVALVASLPTWTIAAAAAVAVGMNILAETVTFSKVIDAVPPLRWFDRLGRISD
jgi:UDP-N-acetylmuramyl pentapeptide phosphotransferase/UDP-N-acetylglucosamine-1-phosphate transferase